MAGSKIEVRKVRKMGRGVFATKPIKVDEVIELCHVILIPNKENSKSNPTQEYSFRWNKDSVAISLGHGSLYNHSYEPNAYVLQDTKNMQMQVIAYKPIKAGEQIFINYNGEVEDRSELWF